jgi:hypothetical protein
MAVRVVERWLWYTQKTSHCAPLDRKAYPSEILDGHPVPWPDWVCRSPEGGGHIDASRSRVDAHVESPPRHRDEVSWTCEFGLFLVARAWLVAIEDLIDERQIFSGDLFMNGVSLGAWATIHGRAMPALSSKSGTTRHCPNCGNIGTAIHGRAFFADPAVLGLPLVVNWNGLFIREDIAASRNLRTPTGAFRPSLVGFEATSE